MGRDIYSTSLFCGMGNSDGLMLLHCLRIIRRLKRSFPGAVVYSPKYCQWKLECLWRINKGAGRMLKSIMNRPRKMSLSGRPARMTGRTGNAHDHHQIRKLEFHNFMEPRKVLYPLNSTREIWVRHSCRQAGFIGQGHLTI